jgi:hypothetical protein
LNICSAIVRRRFDCNSGLTERPAVITKAPIKPFTTARAVIPDEVNFKIFNEKLALMFNAMRESFSANDFKFDDRNNSINKFLNRFEILFTLNQDVLLEKHYFIYGFNLKSPGRWNGYEFPGLEPVPNANNAYPIDAASPRIPKKDGFRLAGNDTQPYIKLHGSHNWAATHRPGTLLISGGNKRTDIDASPIPSWYAQLFRETVCTSQARLMIVGYGFADDHINEVLVEAAAAGALFFIIDAKGLNVLDGKICKGRPLVDHFWQQIVGSSSSPLRSSLADDNVEYGKIARFFFA